MIGAQPYLRIIYVSSDSTEFEKWNNYENETPKVVIISQEYDEKTDNYVSGFDNEGIPFLIGTKKHPKFPALVLGFEENLVAIDKNTGLSYCGNHHDFIDDDIKFTNDFYNYILPRDDPPGGGNPPGDPEGGESCERDQKIARENFLYLQANSSKAIRGIGDWWDNIVEFNIHAVAVRYEKEEQKTFSSLKKNWSGVYVGFFYKQCWPWQSCDYNKVYYSDLNPTKLLFYRWDTKIMIKDMKYVAWERDRSDASSTFKVKLGGVSGSVTYNPKDDFMGEEQIYYCDKIYPESVPYNLGDWRFGLTEDNY